MMNILKNEKSHNIIPIKNKNQQIKSISEKKTKKSEKDNSSDSIKDESPDIAQIEAQFKKNKFLNENFELKNYMDSGSESFVFKLLNKKRRKEYALKVIKNKKNELKNINELQIASKLKSLNIIGFHGYFSSKEDNNEFIILENAKYGNLRSFQMTSLKRKCLSESMLCYLAIQILNGLLYCHKCKVAHMDIKPQNIVMDEYLNAKIIDFSISINYANKKPNEEIKLPYKGTNFYMSPEIYKSQKIKYRDLNKVDAYALGVILYNLAFGYYPYNLNYGDEDYDKVILEKITSKLEIKNESKFSSQFIDFISKLLQSDINKRISIYEALQHPWIKASQILLDEKENLYNINSFVTKLLTDNIKKFNDYLNR